MELSVEPLNLADAGADWMTCRQSLDEWNDAYRRVEAYFLALRVENKLLLSSLVLKILGRANDRFEKEPDRSPVELAAEETDRLLVGWFRRLLNEPGAEREDRLSARGRLALLLVETSVPWQHYILTDQPMPEDELAAMRDAYLKASPDFIFTEMRPREIDLGIVDSASRAMEQLGRWRVAVFWALWIGFGSLLGLTFFLTR
ncbi:MAG: hypothetical protein KDN19_13240 [Verrucomicrobiae bacterium]|nr:hypothetical protein [Verrucomicrobiae bacterium]